MFLFSYSESAVVEHRPLFVHRDMNLVSYDSSSSNGSSDDETSRKKLQVTKLNKTTSKRLNSGSTPVSNCKKLKLPVPDAVKNLFADESHAPVDNTPCHGGRIRSFAHERGNWASFVFIPYNHPDYLTEVIVKLLDGLRLCGEFHTEDKFHLSLSRTFVLRHHWIDPLLESLRKNCKQEARSYSYKLSGIEFYCNDECTRTFLGLTIDTGISQLKSLVNAIDRALMEYKLPVYYKDPSFHISVAWAVGDVRPSVTGAKRQELQDIFLDFIDSYPTEVLQQGTELFLKTGNTNFNIPLS